MQANKDALLAQVGSLSQAIKNFVLSEESKGSVDVFSPPGFGATAIGAPAYVAPTPAQVTEGEVATTAS
eukprot:CAMPEP_0185570356 /NCGR_PEP_ID=MMETSP0434-20130131/2704_1 /TAXON_ID=626734 ORGANISM="Favella taraikaensis, Strain Fe Narragansett Bay" /NCGR_SAMPLE_ID=MMETSP0434 /ASSEMBLY_ACC=CAM_ASM_000379 /LENGTH=68 /DNA_ID=CAMNT_0028185461 /DNA_START=341 /DNA_END=547 /DNA_ORIENTATION=-